MYFWVGVSTVAGALRRCVWLDMGHFQWVPNFYVIIVAPPGIVGKSTTTSIGINLLREVPGINFGPDVVTWQSLVQSLGQSTEGLEMPDGTMLPISAITIEASEFGTFLNPNDREMVDVLVSLWDGKRGVFTKKTKTQGDDVIQNPWVNIIACTTPAWIEGNFPEYMIGGGFTSRCIFVFADKKRQYVAYPALQMPKNLGETKDRLVADLITISKLRGEFHLTEEAVAWGTTWYQEHYEKKPAHLDNARFGGYIARKQSHIHKLAMVLSAAQRDNLEITQDDLIAANTLVTTLESDMPKVFERIGTTDNARGQAELVDLVRTYGKLTKAALYKHLFRSLSYEDFQKALTSAIEAGHVRQVQEGDQLVILTAT